jgi:hypothetical protein
VVLLARQGQKRLFASHFLLLHCGEDGFAVRGDLAFVGGYRAPPEGPFLVHGEGEKDGFWVPRGCPLLSFPLSLLLLETLAAAMALPSMFSSGGC